MKHLFTDFERNEKTDKNQTCYVGSVGGTKLTFQPHSFLARVKVIIVPVLTAADIDEVGLLVRQVQAVLQTPPSLL